jgi:hypothetical protein
MDESDHHTGDRTASGSAGPQAAGAPHAGEQATAPTHTTSASGVHSDTATVIEPTRLTTVKRLDEITGVGQRAAQTIIAEIGLDMTRPVRSGDPRRQDRQGQPLPEGSAR